MSVVLDELQVKATGNTKSAEKSLDNLIGKLKQLQSMSSKTTKTTTKLAKEQDSAAKETTKHTNALGKLAASIARIAFYRAIRSAVKAVTSSFSEGVKNAYMWAAANNDAFKQVMDTYATRSNYIKNSLGALASTVLTALLPAFMQVTNWLVAAINYVNEFIAAITGQDSYLRAREVAIEYADATDDAANAQKRLNQQLMAFDELNVITTPNDRTKSGNDDLKWQDAFVRTQVTRFQSIKSIVQSITPSFDRISTIFGDVSEILNQFSDGFIKGFVDSFNVEDVRDNFNDIFDSAKKIFETLNKWGVSEALGEFVGALSALVAQLTVFGTSSALNHLENVLTMIDSLIHFDFKTLAETFLKDVAQVVSDVVMPVAYVLDIITSNKYHLVDNLKGNDIPSDTFTGGGTGKSFAGNSTTKRASVGSELWLKQNDLYASGGFPDMGSVFVAGEIPGMAEMVGNINGRTGVASGEEITGISEAVYSTGGETAALLRELISVCAGNNLGRPNAAFGKYVSQSLRMYKGVTG